jgi:hypothetical protein
MALLVRRLPAVKPVVVAGLGHALQGVKYRTRYHLPRCGPQFYSPS